MTARGRRLAAQALAVAVSLLIGAGEAVSRGGGRGGGGGGGGGRGGGGGGGMSSHRGDASSRQSINTGGPASRGMGSAKRAQTQPSRPTGGQRAANRPGMDSGRRPEMGDAKDRQDNLNDRQGDRQDFAKDVQEDRQDFWNDQVEDVDWNQVDWDEYHVHDDFEWDLGTWMALSAGTIITVGAWNTMTQQAACNLESVEVNGQAYMKCGNTWYIEAWSGDQVHYIAVEPPV